MWSIYQTGNEAKVIHVLQITLTTQFDHKEESILGARFLPRALKNLRVQAVDTDIEDNFLSERQLDNTPRHHGVVSHCIFD